MNLSRWDRKIAYFLIIIVVAAGLSAPLYIFARNYIAKNHATVEEAVDTATTETAKPIEVAATPSEAPKQEIAKSPPKHTTPSTPATTKTNSDGTKTTTVSESSTSLPGNCKTTKTSSGGSTPSAVNFSDATGQNAALESLLKDYLNSNLKWGGEISNLYEIVVCNAGDIGWEGQYLGSYTQSSGGNIISSYGYIILNTYYHQESTHFNDYMKLVLSHEYGHHYSLYYKWVSLQLANGIRFPDAYYNIRPLSKSNTATDYSLGWANCEAEIVAEDYSYLYSGYGFQAMADTFGYPSAGTKNWFNSLLTGETPTSPETPPAEVPPSAPPTPDTEIPVVTISEPNSNPYLWNDGSDLTISVSGTDNVGVVKLKLYINDTPAGEVAASHAVATWRNSNAEPGSYTIKVEAYDVAGNIGTATITVIKS